MQPGIRAGGGEDIVIVMRSDESATSYIQQMTFRHNHCPLCALSLFLADTGRQRRTAYNTALTLEYYEIADTVLLASSG